MNHALVEAEKNIKIAAARIDAAILYKFATKREQIPNCGKN